MPALLGVYLFMQERLEAPPPRGWRFYALTYATLAAACAASIVVSDVEGPE